MTEITLSTKGKKAQNFYKKGFWNMKMMKNVVKKGYITAEEFEAITGEAYTE